MKKSKEKIAPPEKASPEQIMQYLRSKTPEGSINAHAKWVEEQAELMLELGLARELEELREDIKAARKWLTPEGGDPSGKVRVKIQQWRLTRYALHDTVKLIKERKRAENARSKKAKEGLSTRHEWEKIAQYVKTLRASGVSDRDMASQINELFRVPKSTFRDWRRKQNDG